MRVKGTHPEFSGSGLTPEEASQPQEVMLLLIVSPNIYVPLHHSLLIGGFVSCLSVSFAEVTSA